MARIDPDDIADDDAAESLDAAPNSAQDPVASMHDTESEAGDEEAVADAYDMDDRAARELGAQLDDRDEPEPGLD
jgi:hypothetical protein